MALPKETQEIPHRNLNGMLVTLSASQNILHNIPTRVNWDVVQFDNTGMIPPNPRTFRVPSRGFYHLLGQISWGAEANEDYQVRSHFFLNPPPFGVGASLVLHVKSAEDNIVDCQVLNTVWFLNTDDRVELWVDHQRGVGLTRRVLLGIYQSFMCIYKIL